MKNRSYLVGLAFLVLVILTLAADPVLDRLFSPWAFEQGGRPALTGSWVGQLTTATGQSRGVQLELLLPEPTGRSRRRSRRGSPFGRLGGTARVCDPGGEIRSYTIDGEPADRHATRLTFHARPSETPAPNGLTLSWVNGGWDGAGQLDLAVQLFWEKDGAAVSGSDYPDTQAEAALEMARGGAAEFQARCERLKESRP